MSKQPAPPKPVGRPSIYTPELADEFLSLITLGRKSLRAACDEPGMPAISTVFLWKLNNPEFAAKYEAARKIQDEIDFEDMREIADTPLIGTKTITKAGKTETVVGDNVERSKLMLHARYWILARRQPNRFSDKIRQELSGPDGRPIEVKTIKRVIVDPKADAPDNDRDDDTPGED